MFRLVKDLTGSSISATDGAAGRCRDFLFDDETWTIRYVVADVGGFLARKEVLLSPFLFESLDPGEDGMQVKASKEQVESSPLVGTDAPVSHSYEAALAEHYQHPYYWSGNELWGVNPYPLGPTPEDYSQLTEEFASIEESHLRSTHEVMGYQVRSGDHDLGHVCDAVVETQPWAIRYLIVDTGHWLPGRKVLLSPHWANEISWPSQTVEVENIAREHLESAPEFDPEAGVNRDYEGRLYDYHGKPHYWKD